MSENSNIWLEKNKIAKLKQKKKKQSVQVAS
jgi:hypothetical protein